MRSKLMIWLVLWSFMGMMTTPLQAAMVSTPDMIASEQAHYDREELKSLLTRDDVQDQLQAYGVTQAQAEQRVAAMTNSEVAELNAKIQDAPAGGIVGVIVLIFVVFIITDVIGATDIFPFVRPVN